MVRRFDLVANPRAGAGRAAKLIPAVQRSLEAEGFEVHVHPTLFPRHAGTLVREVLKSSPKTVIGVMGGDGTFNEALQGIHEDGVLTVPSETSFTLIPAGTGGDLRKTLLMPQEPEALARLIAHAEPRRMDVGRLRMRGHDGRARVELFGNIADAGIGGVGVEIVNRGPKWLGGRAAFLLGTLRANVGYRNQPMRVVVDDEVFYEGPVFTAAVANGKAFGGGMFVAPEADPHDGLFDIVVMGDLSTTERLGLTTKIYSGAHIGTRGVTHTRGRVVEITPLYATLNSPLDSDGECPGTLPARFEVLAGAISVLRG